MSDYDVFARAREDESGCWRWTGFHNSKGYGIARIDGRSEGAHRVAFKAVHGTIPDGLEIDHLCSVRDCVNPAHLEAVTHVVNIRRGAKAMQTHCIAGHVYSDENTYRRRNGTRACRKCMNRRTLERSRRRRSDSELGGAS